MKTHCKGCVYEHAHLGSMEDKHPCNSCIAYENYTESYMQVAKDAAKLLASQSLAATLLTDAAKIMEERGKQYDSPGGERSMAKTVATFNAATGRNLTETEGWFFMECLKNVRFFQNTSTPHEDSVKDKIAYAALFGESALDKPPQV